MFFAVAVSTAEEQLNVRTVTALQERGLSGSSMARAAGEGAKLAAVPHKARKAIAKNDPIRLDDELIQKCVGCIKCESSNKAKHACLNSSLDKRQIG